MQEIIAQKDDLIKAKEFLLMEKESLISSRENLLLEKDSLLSDRDQSEISMMKRYEEATRQVKDLREGQKDFDVCSMN